MTGAKKPAIDAPVILLAEDSRSQAERLEYLLETNGYPVRAAANGKEALLLARMDQPSLIISDIIMPEMDGYEFCSQIRQNEILKDIPVILLTALSDPDEIIRGLQSGADDFITKPYNDDRLLSSIRRLIANRRIRGDDAHPGLEVLFKGSTYRINSRPRQILDLLLSVFESAVEKNNELEKTRGELRALNEELEQRVYHRTTALEAENAERRRAELELKRSEEKYKSLTERMSDILWTLDLDLNTTYVSPSIKKVLGFTPEERIHQKLEEMMPPESLGRVQALFIKELEEEKKGADPDRTVKIEIENYHKNGSTVFLDISVNGIRNEEGTLTGIQGISRDITERKRAEEMLRQDKERAEILLELYNKGSQAEEGELYDYALEKAVDLTKSAIGFLHRVAEDQKTIILTGWNKEALSTCSAKYEAHYPLDEAGNWADCVRFKRPVVYNDFPNAPNKKGLPEGHTSIQRFISIPVFEENMVRIIFGVGNKKEKYDEYDVLHLQLVANELNRILMRRKAEEALRHYKEHLEELVRLRTSELENANSDLKRVEENLRIAIGEAETATRAKSDFLAGMSHELRTPLNSIMGFSEVLQDSLYGPLNDKQRTYIEFINISARHLLSLINDILDLSKIEAGKMDLEPSRFGLKNAIELALYMVREKARNHNIDVEFIIQPGADVDIEADERKVKQIMFNLLSNAVKFTPEGGRVRISADRPPEENNTIVISVTDTGIGINPEDLGKLFREFSQLKSPLEGKYEGTGLGLALTKKFVELHGGRIWANSTPGAGSEFTFTLPVKREYV